MARKPQIDGQDRQYLSGLCFDLSRLRHRHLDRQGTAQHGTDAPRHGGATTDHDPRAPGAQQAVAGLLAGSLGPGRRHSPLDLPGY